MQADNTHKSVWLILFAATAASLCCITPVIGVLAGISGIASTFSWLEPARPYLIALTVLLLGLAWYKRLKPATAGPAECDCEIAAKPSFWHTKVFLAMMSFTSALLLTFPYYSGLFFGPTRLTTISAREENITTATLSIRGMTCTGCEQSVDKALMDKPGVIESKSDFRTGIVKLKYDKSRVGISDFRDAVETQVGYRITVSQYP